MAMPGNFITLEGSEGGGKSSIVKEIAGIYRHMDILSIREPGSTDLGERLRAIIQTEDMPDRSELMLFEAARACLVDTVIKPALAKGTHVLCDRFFDSTTAYQGYGRGIPLSDVFALNGMATNGLVPDLTIVLDIDPVLGMARKGKPTDRIEAAGMDFHIRVREAFIEIARMNPDRIARVDASMPLQVVVVEVARLIKERLGWQEQGEKQ